MNQLPNGTPAVGAPGSLARQKAEHKDAALGIIRRAYREQPNIPQLAINKDCNVIGAWSESKGRYVMVAAYAITGTWVSTEYELLINGKNPMESETWTAVPRHAGYCECDECRKAVNHGN